MTSKITRHARRIGACALGLATAVVVAHLTHHLDWTTLPVIGPQGLQLGHLHLFIH